MILPNITYMGMLKAIFTVDCVKRFLNVTETHTIGGQTKMAPYHESSVFYTSSPVTSHQQLGDDIIHIFLPFPREFKSELKENRSQNSWPCQEMGKFQALSIFNTIVIKRQCRHMLQLSYVKRSRFCKVITTHKTTEKGHKTIVISTKQGLKEL